jgi:hypothetical protein|tara:strand:- start:163 stop:408 length:246 start_codon:yes stop_codon:yes gene_type:complete
MSEKTTDEHIVDFVKALKAVEDEMEPFKEHRRDLKKNYVDNGYLTKEEMRFAVKAFRMMRSGEDFNQFTEIYKKISTKVGA